MNVRLAKTAGFCYGVRRAVELAEQAAAEQAEQILSGTASPRGEEPVQVLDFRVYVNNEQKIKLRDWLNANGIRFCRVPKFGD